MSMDENSNPNQNPYDEYQDPYKDQPSDGGGRKPGRTVWTILGIVAAILVLAGIILTAFVLISRNRTAARFQQQNATINAENTAVAIASETAAVLIQRMTEKAMPPTWTPTSAIATATRTSTPLPPTRTSTVAVAADSAARTQTVAAFLTEVAQNTTATRTTATKTTTVRATGTRRTATGTALPTTGFAEDVGLPGLFGAALALIAIIILTRRLRLSSHS